MRGDWLEYQSYMNTSAQLSPQAKSWMRLVVAIEISFVLHLALIFGIQVGAIERDNAPSGAIDVRLAPLPAVRATPAPTQAPAAVLVKAINHPVKSRIEDYQPALQAAPGTPQTATSATPQSGMPEAAANPALLDAPLPADPTYYPAREVDEHPVLINNVQPVYPDKAAEANVKGDVLVLFFLNENGTVDDVSVIEQNPPGYGFGQAVTAWLQHARFKPAMRKGRAVKMRVVYRVTFEP